MAKSTPPPFAVSEFKFPEEMRYCTIVEFTDGDRYIIGLNGEGIATVWDASTTKIVQSQKLPTTYGGPSTWITPNHMHIAVGFVTKPTVLVQTETLKTSPLLDYCPGKMAFSSSGKMMAVAAGGKLRVIKRETNEEIVSFLCSEYGVRILQFAAETEELFVQCDDGIFSWTPGAKELRKRFNPKGITFGKALSANGSTFVCMQRKNRKADYATLFKVQTTDWKAQPLSLRLKRKDCNNSCCISPDGRFFATSTGGTILIWDLVEDKQWLKWQKPNYRSVMGMAFSSDGQRLVCTPDYKVHVLDFRTGAKSHLIEGPTLTNGEHHCVRWVGPDDQMDRADGHLATLNPLPVLCKKCESLDLDFVSSPYALGKKIDAPVDMAPAVAGNMLVRETLKRALETVAPGQCKFYPTVSKKTKAMAPWFLAVPQYLQLTAKPSAKKCPQCEAPESWERPTDNSPVSKHDIFKAENCWGISGDERDLFISIRLETLLKKLGLRGMLRYYDCKQVPTKEDLAWAEEKVKMLSKASGAPTINKADIEPWFNQYLKKSAKKKAVVYDFTAVEKKQKVKLPQSYRDFLSTVGTKTFKDVNQEEGFAVHILPPQKLDFKEYRMPTDPSEDEKEHKIDGVIFATTDHGDVFCFDIGAKGPDYPVYHYQHETDEFEPFAEHFAGAIKRFVGKD